MTKGQGGWNETVLYAFTKRGLGCEPTAAPTLDGQGNLYGVTSFCGGAVWELLHGSWKEKTLFEFGGAGGGDPGGALIFDKAGNLYGTTAAFGKYRDGAVFELSPSKGGKWKETVLHSFKGGSDGNNSSSTLTFDKAGNLYGTTYLGGDPSCFPPHGCGTVFKLTRSAKGTWKETILHRFNGNDGFGPGYVKLAIDAAGNLYGTTANGGNAGCGNYGCGVVFEITP